MRSSALAQALDNDEDDESTASEASSATAEPVDVRRRGRPRRHGACEKAGLALRRRGADSVARGNSRTGAAEPADAAAGARGAARARGDTAAAADGLGHGRWSHDVRRGRSRRFELNAAALPAVGDAGEDADTLYSPTAPLPRPTAWVTGGGALTYQSPRRRSEPLRPSELPAVGAAGEDAATLYSPAAAAAAGPDRDGDALPPARGPGGAAGRRASLGHGADAGAVGDVDAATYPRGGAPASPAEEHDHSHRSRAPE